MKNKMQVLVLLVILAIHCAFISQKEGYHMDELISFEFANAEYNPWIVPIQPQGRLAKFMQEEIDGDTFGETVGNFVAVVQDVLVNRGNSKLLTYKADVYEEPVWISRERFEAYVTTGQKDRFNLLSVYFNVKDDNHPPVHFMLLHLISSLVPLTVSVWMGGVINLLALFGSCLCMMKGGELLEKHRIMPHGKGKLWGFCAVILYGCSSGAIATTLLFRMYGVMTFLCVWSLYWHAKKWLEGSFDKCNKGLIAVTVLGFLTQYFFLFYCILLAAVTFVLLLVCKRKKEALIYIRTMLISACLGVCIFPFSIADVFSSGRGVEALNNLQGSLADYVERLGVFGRMLLERCFGFVPVGVCVLLAGILCMVWWRIKRKQGNTPLVWMLLLPPVGYFLLAAKMSPMYVDRYIMAAFPFVMMLAALWLVLITDSLQKKQVPACVLAVVLLGGFAVGLYDGEYLYTGYEKQIELAEQYGDHPCICLYEGSGYYENLPEFCEYEETLLITPAQLAQRADRDSISALDSVVVVMKGVVDEEKCVELLGGYGLTVEDVLLTDGVHGDRVYLLSRQE